MYRDIDKIQQTIVTKSFIRRHTFAIMQNNPFYRVTNNNMKTINKFTNISLFATLFLFAGLIGCSDSGTSAIDEEMDAPTVESTSPVDNESDIVRNKTITITFDQAMDPATVTTSTFTVKNGSSDVAGTVESSGVTATFKATNTLNALADYTVTLSTGAKSATGIAIAQDKVWSFTTGGSTDPLDVVDLGTAGNYVILAKTAINNSPTSAITGDLGLSPAAGSFITGFAKTDATGYATSDQVTGKIYAADMADPTPSNLTTAVENMITAYDDAAGRPNPDFFELYTGNIGGKTLTPGLYKWTNTVLAPTDVTISGGPDDVWIFQIAENMTFSSNVQITLSGGAQAKNIFWQVAGEVTLGTGSHFEGIILSMTGITMTTGATLNGRMLAQTAVILDENTVVAY